jgi:hypothetical protein
MNSSLTPFEHTPPPQQVTNDQAKKPTSLEEKRGTSRGAGKTTQSNRQVRQEDDTTNESFVTAFEGPDDDGSTELAFYAGFRVEHRHVITAVVQRRRWRPAFTQSRPDRPHWKKAMDHEMRKWSRGGMCGRRRRDRLAETWVF